MFRVALYSWSVVEDLVARREAQRAEDRGDPGRRIRHERQALRIRAEEWPEHRAASVEQVGQVVREEPDRLGLEAGAPACLGLDDRGRAGAV